MFLKRHYDLLKFISCEKRWFSVQEIAKALNCSIKTIQRDLIQIIDYLPVDWFIQISKRKEVRLKKPAFSSIDTIQVQYFKHTLLFQALNKLLCSNVKTIDELARSLYIQTTKMRSVLLEVESYLKQYNLKLKKRPLRIEGNETNLLLMYYKLYLKSYDKQEWPFHEFRQNMLENFLQEIEKIMGIKFYKESIRKLSIFISIYLMRKKNRYTIPLDKKTISDCMSTSVYREISVVTTEIFGKYGVNLIDRDIVILIIAVNHSEYYYERQEIIKKDYLACIMTEDNTLYKNLKDLIQVLEQTFNMDLLYDDEFIFYIICTMKPHVYKSKIFTNKNYVRPTTLYIKNKHLSTFNQVKIIISEWIKKYNMGSHIGENEIANLTMHIEAKYMKMEIKNKKIVLLLNSGKSWDIYMQEYLNVYFNKNIEYLNINFDQLINSKLDSDEISCIVTDTLLNQKMVSIPIILISDIPVQRDLEEIARYI
ncbi:hypothetical protein BM86_24255 [Bacillus thuringiensis]|uniref:Capsule synthesis positive regulator AcpB n=1 Tax=Bacillus thuringiensis TaxID=1428 RepID=A0A9W3X4M7_BACTU|nr:helix-turn-helix domain-containing protein [Bacillus thuringiensis]ANS52233.1 capsule synthesis positive regulator AcpB [Bacillus thuringiensis]MBH0338505.1 hypothetical protein [Bacillus thuringiensis]